MHQQITLRDGRRLGYARYGEAEANAVLYFHGWPGSRLEPALIDHARPRVPARILALDRPGYGLSDFQPSRKLADWPQDVRQFADELKLERFAVLGVSGGGPYAAACAARLPDRVSGLWLVSALGPLDSRDATRGMIARNCWLVALGRTVPRLARVLVGLGLERMRRTPERFLRRLERRLPPRDQRALAVPPFRQALVENFREALRPGVAGAAWDGTLYAQPWGFRLQDIAVPAQVWHGEADNLVPPAMGRHYADTLPTCRATIVAGEGHFSLALNRMREIVEMTISGYPSGR